MVVEKSRNTDYDGRFPRLISCECSEVFANEAREIVEENDIGQRRVTMLSIGGREIYEQRLYGQNTPTLILNLSDRK